MNNETNNPETNTAEGLATTARPRCSYYHPNGRNTGAAVQFELHPAYGAVDGSIFATFAKQKTVGTREGSVCTFPRFDWTNRICVKLDMSDLVQMLLVFRGMQESIADGKGLFHKSETHYCILKLEHRIEPQPGYLFEVSRKAVGDNGETERIGIVFTVAEALGLSLAIEQSLDVIAFGIPVVLRNTDTSAVNA